MQAAVCTYSIHLPSAIYGEALSVAVATALKRTSQINTDTCSHSHSTEHWTVVAYAHIHTHTSTEHCLLQSGWLHMGCKPKPWSTSIRHPSLARTDSYRQPQAPLCWHNFQDGFLSRWRWPLYHYLRADKSLAEEKWVWRLNNPDFFNGTYKNNPLVKATAAVPCGGGIKVQVKPYLTVRAFLTPFLGGVNFALTCADQIFQAVTQARLTRLIARPEKAGRGRGCIHGHARPILHLGGSGLTYSLTSMHCLPIHCLYM